MAMIFLIPSLRMSEPLVTPTIQLNTRGLRCPEPVMMLHQAIRKSKSGDVSKCLPRIIRRLGIFQNSAFGS